MMRATRWVLTAATLALLTACGGGGTSDSPSVACVPATAVRVQLFGDSTQAGYSTNADATSTVVAHNAAAELQAFFSAPYGAGAVIVASRAGGGTTAKGPVAGTDGLAAYQTALRTLAKAPAVIFRDA